MKDTSGIKMEHPILDQYEILTPLASDGDVYLVMDRKTREILVEKITSIYNPDLYQMMEEKQFYGVPAVVCMEEIEGKWILIEEYIHGRNLYQHIRENGVFSEEKTVSIIMDLCLIIEQFHSMAPPVIHRDIKPENIILSNESHIYLIDFNTSREYKSSSNKDTVPMVSFHFSPPELYGFGQSDQRSDIYSLGATMHYLLTGGHLNETSYTGPLSDIIKTCTMINPDDRYQSIADLREALAQHNADKSEKDQEIYRRLPWLRKVREKTASYTIPGFRTGHPLKMINAIIVYLFLTVLCFGMEIESSQGIPLKGPELWIERFFTWLFFILAVFILFDYRGWLGRIPVLRKIKPRLLRAFLAILILMFLILTVIMICLALLPVIS